MKVLTLHIDLKSLRYRSNVTCICPRIFRLQIGNDQLCWELWQSSCNDPVCVPLAGGDDGLALWVGPGWTGVGAGLRGITDDTDGTAHKEGDVSGFAQCDEGFIW